MPASAVSLRLTDAYRHRLQAMKRAARDMTARSWQRVTLEDLDGSHAEWLPRAAAVIEEAQRAGVVLTAAYVAAFVASETDSAPRVPPVDSGPYVQAESGAPIAASLAGTLIAVKVALKDGRDPAAALSHGGNVAARLAATNAMVAPRRALSDTLTRDEFAGWRRVARQRACLACLADAGKTLPAGTPLRYHDECSCTAEPVVRGVTERVQRPTGVAMFHSMSVGEQDSLYGEKAALIRQGDATLEDFKGRSPMALVPDRLTEAPLDAATH